MSLYKTLTLLKAAEQMPPVRSFLKDTFFPGVETFVTEEVLLDVKKGTQKMAPFVAPRVGGVTIEREGFRTDKYKAPRIAPQRPVTIDDISSRGYGENVISTKTPAQRQSEIVAKDMQEFDEMISRREEWMAAQILFYGKAILKGYTDSDDKRFVEQMLDYSFTNKEELVGAEQWGAGGDIYTQIEEWRLDLIQKTGVAPTMMVLGRTAMQKLRNDENMRKLLDIRNMNFGELKPSVQADGTTFIGRLAEFGLDLYTYDAWYKDELGEMKPFVPQDHILLGSPNLGSFVYGAVTQLEDKTFKTYEGSRVPKMWADENAEAVMMRLSSRPIPKPSDIDAWFSAKVV